MTLSPDDRQALRGCSVYAIVALYVRPDRLVARTVKLVERLGGQVLSVDEENRVVRANVSARSLRELAESVRDLVSAASVEVKVTCRWSGSLREALRRLSDLLTGTTIGASILSYEKEVLSGALSRLGLPAELAQVIMKALDPDPSRRHPSPLCLWLDLKRVLEKA